VQGDNQILPQSGRGLAPLAVASVARRLPTQMQTEERTDEQLMQALAQGDRAGFDELFLRYRQRIYAFYRRRTLDQSRAERLNTRDLSRAAACRRPVPTASTLPDLSFCHRLSNSWLRAAKGRDSSIFFLPNVNTEPTRIEPRAEILWLKQGLSRLEKSDRELMMLREFEQLSYAEIAELLRLPINTVRSRLFRARMALREKLEGIPTGIESVSVENGDRA